LTSTLTISGGLFAANATSIRNNDTSTATIAAAIRDRCALRCAVIVDALPAMTPG